MPSKILAIAAALLCATLLRSAPVQAAQVEATPIQQIVAEAIRPLMATHGIPGMAVGIVRDGESHVYTFGVASKATNEAVTETTLFEIGSLSKTFTATLASYAQATGHLALSDPASKDLLALRGSAFDQVSLLDLGTHTSGGLPLQVPDEITTTDQLMTYFRTWKPSYKPGTVRTYANPSIGLLGMITAASMKQDFVALAQGSLYPALGLENTYLVVPKDQTRNYAQGYTRTDTPIRMAPGMLAAEAYGIRTTAGDLLRFVEANMRMLSIDATWQRAITDTHTGYDQIGGMIQDLIWEQYPDTADLKTLLAGNSNDIGLKPNPVTPIEPPLPPRDDILINKTGSTNGFAGYVIFEPGKKLGIVMLANKNYPIEARVTAAYQMLTKMGLQTSE